MMYHVYWTNKALLNVSSIVDYIKSKWTQKEVDAFLNEVEEIIRVIERNPKLFKSSIKRKNIHIALVTKHNMLVYQIQPLKKQINILLIWDTRQSPKRLNY